MRERHRSPCQSPSQSPWRSTKCWKDKSFRMVRRPIWTRAKHPVGLERPHFLARFRAQSDSWVAPALTQIPRLVLPAPRASIPLIAVHALAQPTQKVHLTKGEESLAETYTQA